MRKLCLILLLLFVDLPDCNAQSRGRVDEMLELSGIVWRLAGAGEFLHNEVIDSYATDIDTYFSPYKDHPLFAYIRRIREVPHEIGYDAVPTSALLMVQHNGTIRLNPDIDLARYETEFDARWDTPTLKRYTALLNDFYKKSRFRRFYDAHRALYDHAELKIDSLVKTIDTRWFESFYGKSFGNPTVNVCMSYGFNNFALTSALMSLFGQENYGIIIGCNYTDKNGLPDFSGTARRVILHEFGHNFANPILAKYKDRMVEASQVIYPLVKERLAKRGYGPASTLSEGLNELFMNMYYLDIYKSNPFYNIADAEESGFVWMGRAIRFMDNFRSNRDRYQTIDDFMPEIVGFINYTAEHIDTIMREFENRHPYVAGIFPAQKTGVDPDIKQIRVQFTETMYSGITGYWEPVAENCKMIPIETVYWEGDTYVIELSGRLDDNTFYGVTIPQDLCVAYRNGQRIEEDLTITFKTGKL